jgi:geranylgeranyl diphosphate synthase type II
MILLIESCKLFSDKYDESVPFACAVEMIHTYSLIHDDLPAIDNSSLRRGRPCNHIVFGDNMAILAGDGLLHYAFEIMARHSAAAKGADNRFPKAMYEIAKACGINGMLYGESLDVQNENTDIDIELLTLIHVKKTAELIAGAVKAGAVIGGAGDSEIKAVEEYAYNFGLAFQITDDILDVVGDTGTLGKDTGNDANKTTYASLYGVDKAMDIAKEYLEKAKERIRPLDRYDFFSELCDYILAREY